MSELEKTESEKTDSEKSELEKFKERLWGTGVRCFLSDEGRIKHSSGKYFSFSHTGHTVKTD